MKLLNSYLPLKPFFQRELINLCCGTDCAILSYVACGRKMGNDGRKVKKSEGPYIPWLGV